MTEEVPGTTTPVSVVIATMDRPVLLRRALDAVLTQEHPGPIEVVVVYDHREPDHSLADLPAAAAENRSVRVVENERIQGLAGARNHGVSVASHDWIAFCDDDDEWLPGKLVAQLAAVAEHGSARVATTGIYIHYEGEDIERLPDPAKLTFEGFLDDRMTDVHPSATLVARSLLDEIGEVDEKIPGGYGEDYDWLLRAARASAFAVALQPLVRVHWHGGSFFFERWKTIDEALEYLVDKYPEFHRRPHGLARIRGQQAVAQAAMKQRRRALRTCAEIVRLRPTEKRTPVAVLVALGVPAGFVLRTAHRLGKGI